MGKHLSTMTRMRNLYDLDDYIVLEEEGWKSLSTSTLLGYKKDVLIQMIRMLEHNWAGSIKAATLQSRRLENFYNYYKDIGEEDLFTKLTEDDYRRDEDVNNKS